MSYEDDGVAMRSLKSNSSNSDASENATVRPDTAAALLALHNPQFSAAIKALAALQQPDVAAALSALRQYNDQRVKASRDVGIEFSSSVHTRRRNSMAIVAKRMKPVVRNNLFIITMVWTLLGLFLLYAAQSQNETSVAVFVIYGIVQCTLAVFICLVTYKQLSKIQYHTVTLGFLVQGWLALTFNFAGLYLFFYHSFTINMNQWAPSYTNVGPLTYQPAAPVPIYGTCTHAAAGSHHQHASDGLCQRLRLHGQLHRRLRE